jgi:hypothetical protein
MSQTRKQKILEDVKKARRQRLLISIVVIVVLAVGVVAAVVLLGHTPQNPLIGTPISSTMQDYLTGVSNTTLAAVGAGTGVTSMVPLSGYPELNSSENPPKPEFLYVGAEYCPYCAAERWSMIVALSRFGTFTPGTLEYMMSADSPEVFPDTPTFTFIHATYSSPYIAFVPVETSDRNKNPLQSLTSDQNNLVNTIDCYQGQCGGLAFIDIANRWIMGTTERAGSQYLPSVLTGNWTQIGAQLDDHTTAIAQAVDGAANTLITAICNVDGKQPTSVCTQSFAQIPQAPIGITNAPPSNSSNMIVTASNLADDSVWRSYLRRIF